jgi:hypothetical protein
MGILLNKLTSRAKFKDAETAGSSDVKALVM